MIRPRPGASPGRGPGNWNITHGGARRGRTTPEFRVWLGMRNRCGNPHVKSYPDYGGRGIHVCDRWQLFENFFADMGPRPSSAHSINRINNNLGYEPSNCVWSTRSEQNRNKRKMAPKSKCKHGHDLNHDNVYIRSNGKRQCKTCRKLALRRLQDQGYFRAYAKARRNGFV